MSNVIVCTKSVMDNIADPDIRFDDNGISNYYYDYHEKAPQRVMYEKGNSNALDSIVKRIKSEGRKKEYDCLIGVSGGVDSTYLAYLTKKLGLRPLAIHFDNGWNSELAVKNIESTLEKLDIDLFTYVVDWEEFRDLQLSFLKASTPDGEIPTDHAILALLYDQARKHGIKYILSGNNFETEGILPKYWSYGHIDWKYIKGIHDRFGSKKLRTFPRIHLPKYLYLTFVKRIKMVSILNYLPYNKEEAMELLKTELSWKYYGGKHYESVYTRFFQGYILPTKFKIDKRKAHLSNLIFSKQISRDEALLELREEIYPKELFNTDLEFVKKKLGLSESAFDEIMIDEPKYFDSYPNASTFQLKLRRVLNYLRRKRIFYS